MSNDVVGRRVAEMLLGVGITVATPRQAVERSESVLASELAASEFALSRRRVEAVSYEMRLDEREGLDAPRADRADEESRDWS